MLVGTVTGDTEAFGIFLDQTANKIVRLKLGDLHGGWTLRQVRGREVMLQKHDEIIFLALPPPGTKPAVSGTQVAQEAAHAILSTMLDNVAQGTAMFDQKHRLIGWNGRLQRLLDLPDGALS